MVLGRGAEATEDGQRASETITLYLLGAFEVVDPRRAPAAPVSQRLLELVAYLVLHRDRPLPRAELAAQLWPDSLDAQALANLRTLLHRLPRALPALSPFVERDENCVRWRGGVSVTLDVAEFEAAVHAETLASLRTAVDLYRGDLLPEVAREWVLGERERLRVLFAAALRRLAEQMLDCGDLSGARQHGERLVRCEPASEENWRLLMRIRGAQGGPAAVSEVFARCEGALTSELGVAPAAATRQLRDQLCERLNRGPRRGPAPAEIAAQPLWVGRLAELAACEAWLRGEGPEVLYVYGPAGSGKTALLHRVARIAASFGRAVCWLDGRDPASVRRRASFLRATAQDGMAPVLLCDNVTSVSELLAGACAGVRQGGVSNLRLVAAGRSAPEVAWDAVLSWRRRVLPLRLGVLSHSEACEYLRRAGLADPRLVRQLVATSGGNARALALGADLAQRTPTPDLRAVEEYPGLVHELAREITGEVADPRYRQLLEAGALVRHLDAELLGAMCDTSVDEADFEILYALSACRPTMGGMQLDAGVRRLLAQDLRWRRPGRYTALRRRAFAFYRQRLVSASPPERGRLCSECLFLWDQERTLSTLVADGEPEGVRVEAGNPEDHPGVRRIWARWLALTRAAAPAANGRDLAAVLGYPGTRLRLARDGQGDLLGFSAVVPICRESLDMLLRSGTTAPLVAARWPEGERAALPVSPAESRLLHWRCLVYGDREPEATHAALWWDLLSLVSEADAVYAATPVPEYAVDLEALGFRHLAGADSWNNGALHPVKSYELDLTRTGLDGWLAELLGFADRPSEGRVAVPAADQESEPV